MKAYERLLDYIGYETTSDENSGSCPSTPGQKVLAEHLADEMRLMGLTEVECRENGYVYATLEAKCCEHAPVIGLIAHMDTSPDMPGRPVPRIIRGYDGADIVLSEDAVMRTEDFPQLALYKGKTLIVTDGGNLLGADDKAGIADILTAVEKLIAGDGKHGKVRIAFTPDEEIGRGADEFDVKGFGADYAYTVDGGELGEIEYECFNASSARVTVTGRNIHPGSAKGKMLNSLLVAMEFQSMLPVFERPEHTEGYEGFAHLNQMNGTVESTEMDYIIRDHDAQKLEARKKLFTDAAGFLNSKYGKGTVSVKLIDSYRNMREMIEPHMEIIHAIENAMRECGTEPKIVAIRGGTDGARLSYEGLPCPNICTGGDNFHGRYEFACAEDMETVSDILKTLVLNAAK